ncbi:Proteophosphoglycan ppg4 [Mycena venus]|uniref:Proteophosphoglycan ppg4 n=1 Tax=Mycena venus TaxID=2733690 RepID=A0A8H6Z9W6_9AGAR|nr:Proteophosphoglycan ppg4 [Mycena venus]
MTDREEGRNDYRYCGVFSPDISSTASFLCRNQSLTMSWHDGGPTYNDYFSRTRPKCPPDDSIGTTITNHTEADEGYRTSAVLFHDTSNLSHLIAPGVKLDLAFVQSVLSSTGPDTVRSSQRSMWDWADWRVGVSKWADGEPAYYPWLEWAVYAPAAHAAGAVRDKLYASTDQAVPLSCQGTSTIRCVTANHPKGVTDIIHELERENQAPVACTLHEVKRAAVLTVDEVSVLQDLVTWARSNGGFKFREEAGRSQEKARRLLFQAMDELLHYDVAHIVLSTQHHYVLLSLSPTYQFLISRLYKINDSSTQLQDITDLVLFYAHAIVNPGAPYSQQPDSTSGSPVFRVSIPAFPPHLFQPYEALFRNGRLTHRAKLSPVKKSTNPSFPALSLRFHGDGGLNRADADVVISFGRLVFWFLDARVVAKTANSPRASQRLSHEFKAYNIMWAFQGVAIPTLVGLYTNNNNGSSVLILSHAGAPLGTFEALTLAQRRTLLSHIVCLHQTGIQHNDIEPRNVMLSPSSAPVIIDFDHASLDHICQGKSCTELLEVAQRLGLNLADELGRSKPTTPISPTLVAILASLYFLVIRFVWGKT